MKSLLSNLDFFVAVPPIHSLEALAFLQFPVAQVSPPPPPITVFSDLLFLCIGSVSDVSLQIDKFQVETALSKFIADVFPQSIGFSAEDFKEDEDLLPEEGYAHEDEEKCAPSHRNSISEIEVSKIKGQRHAVGDKVTQRKYVMQFETPELDVFAENATFFENEGIQNLSKAAEVEESLGMPGLAIYCPSEFPESFLSVQDIEFEYPMEEKFDSADNCSLKDQMQFDQLSFPTLEVDETLLDSPTGFSAEEKIISYFQTIELHGSAKDSLDAEDIELWSGKECDISGVLSDHFLSGGSLGSDLKENFPKVDLISLVEIPHIRMKSEAQETLDADFYPSKEPVIFNEYYILDLDSVQGFEAFLNRQSSYETGTYIGMFDEEVNFMDFNKLVVCHELNLVDDTFKSFPVPVICDRERLRPFEGIIKEKLANLKPHPVSALDEIYLDWHLLEEDKYSEHAHHCQNILRDMTVHTIDLDWDSLGEKDLIYEFVLFDDSVSTEQPVESKVFLSGSSGISAVVESSAEFSEPDNGEQFVKKKSERGSLLFKSKSESDDIDFFLNAEKATTGSIGESGIREVNTKASSVAAIPRRGESVPVLDKDETVDLEEIFDDFSTTEIYDNCDINAERKVESQSVPLPIPSMPFIKEPKYPVGNPISLPEAVILVNTQNLDKEMIVSRRSTYQRILAIEKEGAQVVERDSELPVDIILNASTCLVWYNCMNIGKKSAALDEASSSLPLCIENIATNILTLLSFNFTACIVVFEGEDNFLSTVMEFSDELYAAAASLGIDVQPFFSYSSDSTDEIIMNCIHNEKRGLYPRMSESETLAESFLTKFPSVNPLTAHAILSSGGILMEFLEWSSERRIHAVQKYHVPDESIALLCALCKYGEREDSGSIMTDCSSSVSSGTDSKGFNLNIASKRKRRTSDDTLRMSCPHMDDSLGFEPAKQFSKHTVGPSLVQKPYDSSVSKDPESFHKFRNPALYDSNLFHEEPNLDVNLMTDPPDIPKRHDFQTCNEPRMFKKIRAPEFSFNDMLSGHLRGDLRNEKGSAALFEDQKGEVIDLTRSPRPGKKEISSIDDSISFLMPDFDDDTGALPEASRNFSFGKNQHTRFPTSDGMFSEKRMWESVNDQRRRFELSGNSYSGIDFGDDVSLPKHPNKLLDECFKQRSAENSHGFEFIDNESSKFEGTLKNALSFSSPGKKSPWTMEFLNKVRDKSRLRHQSLPRDASGFLGNISKDFKRRSPSILEFFKYQGGSTKRIPAQKKQRQSEQKSGSSKAAKRSASASSIQPSWTPADKRARQTLSFTTNSGERQAKLVWNDGPCNRSNKFRSQI